MFLKTWLSLPLKHLLVLHALRQSQQIFPCVKSQINASAFVNAVVSTATLLLCPSDLGKGAHERAMAWLCSTERVYHSGWNWAAHPRVRSTQLFTTVCLMSPNVDNEYECSFYSPESVAQYKLYT